MAGEPLPKALSGLLRGGTTISDAVPKLKQPVITTNTHDDIGAAGYDSIVFTASGVTKPAPGGENPYQNATKKLSLFEVEYLRLQRAKFLEDRKAKSTKQAQNEAIKEIDGVRGDWTSLAVSKASALPQDVANWFKDLFKKEEEKVEIEKKIKFRRNKNAELASIAGKNAKESAVRAREEMQKARASMEQARQAADDAKNMPELYRKKHVDMTNATHELKPVSSLLVKLSQGKNFPLIGDGYLRHETNVYAKVMLHDSKAQGIEPQNFYTQTQYRNSQPQFLQNYEFHIAADWEDEDRHEFIEIIFYHESKSLVGPSKQDPEHDHEYGRYKIPLADFVKLTPERRFPDGSKEPALFAGSLFKWFKLHDVDNQPVAGLDSEEGPPSFQAQFVYTDSLKTKRAGQTGVKPIQLPLRAPYRAPAPKPGKTWRDHPDWSKNHGPGLCVCCQDEFYDQPGKSPRSPAVGTPKG